MKLTKKLILNQVRELYLGYKDNTVVHDIDYCKLCVIYRGGGSCNNCINNVFKTDYSISCVTRGISYSKLNYYDAENNINLYHFWREIYLLIKKTNAIDVLDLSDSFRGFVLLIAEKYR